MAFLPHSARTKALFVVPVVVIVGLGMKAYVGPAQWWLNNWGASFAYEIFFMLLLFAAFPGRAGATPIAVGVCVATCALEFLQLWEAPLLETARATVIGRSLLGHAFSWADLPAYPLGCFLGWLLLRSIAGPPERPARDQATV